MVNKSLILFVSFGVLTYPCVAFQNVNNKPQHQARGGGDGVACHASRRDILSLFVPATLASTALLTPIDPSFAAAGDDLTTQMFNSDGSLKDGYESEVKFRDVSFKWDQSDSFALNEDGMNMQGTKPGSQYTLSYQYPLRWSDGKDGDPIYFDRSEGVNNKASKRITIFQASGTAAEGRLEKATTIGVAKALDAPKDTLGQLYKADIVSGRTVEKGNLKYFEFDMASAPDTCGNSKENLGLGFCPYDNLYLVSATIANDRLYCMVVECDSTKMWKLESKELKRIRSTFSIEESPPEAVAVPDSVASAAV